MIDHTSSLPSVVVDAFINGGGIVCNQPIPDGLARHYVLNAGVHAIHQWVKSGKAPKIAERFSTNPATVNLPALIPPFSAPTFNLDTVGNVKGGVRTPFVDVPTAVYSGLSGGSANTVSGQFCFLSGTQNPIDTSSLYRNHFDYVFKVLHSVLESVENGFIRPSDAVEILITAIKSGVGK